MYFRLGILFAMALVHGGGGFQLSGSDPSTLVATIEEVADHEIREILLKVSFQLLHCVINSIFFKKIHDTEDDEAIKQLAIVNSDLLLDCGYVKPASTIKLRDKSDLIHTVTLHKVLLSVLGEMNQFRSGIDSTGLGVYEYLEKYYDLCAPFYCLDVENKLTSGMVYAVIMFVP